MEEVGRHPEDREVGLEQEFFKNVWFLLLFLETGSLYVVVAMLGLDM